jgi:chromatin segregation and condensation protein Rec8/ScpA/Scc1 (kleisin family)
LKLRVALASTFSASLELSRQQMLQADQRGQFEEIILLGAL